MTTTVLGIRQTIYMSVPSNEDGIIFERHPKWYYNDAEGVIHIIDITRHIIYGESLMSRVIGKVMLSTPETAFKNFLHAMATVSSEPDVEHVRICI
jgi:hypothetical protein